GGQSCQFEHYPWEVVSRYLSALFSRRLFLKASNRQWESYYTIHQLICPMPNTMGCGTVRDIGKGKKLGREPRETDGGHMQL
ncbi:unnamed protein product, partial [Ixodes persulcatus]